MTVIPAHHPVVNRLDAERAVSFQLRLADRITAFAGSMPFVYLHVLVFGVWMVVLEQSPWPTLTLAVSLEAIFLSCFVMIGQNRQAAFQQAKADHEFLEGEQELKLNTELTREIHELTREVHERVVGEPADTRRGSEKRLNRASPSRRPRLLDGATTPLAASAGFGRCHAGDPRATMTAWALPRRRSPFVRPGVVARTSALRAAVGRVSAGVTLVSAPAGSGKTVLLRSWIEAAGLARANRLGVGRARRARRAALLAVGRRGAARPRSARTGSFEDLAPTPEFDGEAVGAASHLGARLARRARRARDRRPARAGLAGCAGAAGAPARPAATAAPS